MITEYRNWLAAKKEKATEGDVAEYVAWYVKHPSPLGGLFGRELTRPEIIRNAMESAAVAFEGTKVAVRHTETPESGARIVSVVTGTLLGRGFVCVGTTSQEAVMVKNESGTFVAIPVRSVTDMENA
jgi:hypothetical protein